MRDYIRSLEVKTNSDTRILRDGKGKNGSRGQSCWGGKQLWSEGINSL